MNRKNVSTVLSFAFLIFVICSAILPVSSLQNNMIISSYGTVNYSGTSLNTWNLVVNVTPTNSGTTSPSIGTLQYSSSTSVSVSASPNQGYTFVNWELDNTISTQNPISVGPYSSGTHTLTATFKSIVQPPTSSGEVFLWVQFGMTDGNGNPNADAQRIAKAKATYGNPTWVEAGNWGFAHLTTKLINFFHSYGIKVSCRLWSRYADVPLDTLKHDMNVENGYGGSVDYQLSIGPEVDMIMIDECDEGSVAYYKDLADYVHSKGKLFAVNPGGGQVHDATPTYADKVSVEFWWREFINGRRAMIAQYPNKFIACSNDWGYANQEVEGYPNTRVDLARAVLDTKEAWDGGVYYHESRSGEGMYLPDWWEQYLSQLPK